jgi:DNA-binding LytR/AlgR family response regulator
MTPAATALIADDEPLLRDSLERALAQAWPQLQVVAQARNGREAVELFHQHRPDIVFLDVHMPGLNGMEAAKQIAREAQLVFVTAYQEYALQAFERGALDYLVKPVEEARLADTVQRLQERIRSRVQPGSDPALEAVIDELARRLTRKGVAARADGVDAEHGPLQWIRASVGSTLKLIPVDEILFLRSDEKYTLVVTAEGEALIRTPIRELVERLDAQRFVQVHRSVLVNLHAISHVTRGPNETADLHLKGRPEVLPVSRSYLHLFRQM